MKIQNLTPLDSALAELGRRLALARKTRGMSQQELADAAGIGVATLRRIEGGNDSQLGSWIKALGALDLIDAVDQLLPEEIRSPMADVKAASKRRRAGEPEEPTDPWGGQAP